MGNEQLEPLIFSIRGQRVLLDADLARVYGVSTKQFNVESGELVTDCDRFRANG